MPPSGEGRCLHWIAGCLHGLLPSLRVTTKLDFDPYTYEPDGPETSLPMNLGSGAVVSALGAKATWIGLHPP